MASDVVPLPPWQGLPISASDLPHALPCTEIDPGARSQDEEDPDPDRPTEGVPTAEERAALIAKDDILQESAAILRDEIGLKTAR